MLGAFSPLVHANAGSEGIEVYMCPISLEGWVFFKHRRSKHSYRKRTEGSRESLKV